VENCKPSLWLILSVSSQASLVFSAAGFKVVRGLYHIADSIGNSSEDVRLFATNTDDFLSILHGLSQGLELVRFL